MQVFAVFTHLPSVLLQFALSTLALVVMVLYMKRSTFALVDTVLKDVGEQLTKIFNPKTTGMYKQAMSIIGGKGNVVKADSALRSKFAGKLVDGIPSLQLVLDQFDIEPIEALKLYNDPIVGPIIQSFLNQGASMLQGKNLNVGQPNLLTANPGGLMS